MGPTVGYQAANRETWSQQVEGQRPLLIKHGWDSEIGEGADSEVDSAGSTSKAYCPGACSLGVLQRPQTIHFTHRHESSCTNNSPMLESQMLVDVGSAESASYPSFYRC